MITYDRYLAILRQSDAQVQQAAAAAFARLLEKIRNGEKPQPALQAVLKEFNADAIAGFREALNSVLQSALGVAEVKAYKVGGVKLSDALYAHAKAVSATTRQIIEKHLQGPHAARELAKTLYEGYDFKDDPLDVAGKLETLPKYLRPEFNKALAAKLKTPALRAAYLDAIRQKEAGAGMDQLEKVLKVAFYERNRYYANRIARTELHRNYTDQQARELMAEDRIQYVQFRMSVKHPKVDICDFHARLDAYGLGPGIYPKAEAPKPPLHPHCLCRVVSRLSVRPKQPPRFNPKAEQAFLAKLPAKEARDVAGSWEKRRRVLEDGDTLEAIYNEGKDPLYQWKRVGDILTPTTATEADAAVSNAYEVAKAGGKNFKWYKLQQALPAPMLERAIESFRALIAEHEALIKNPLEQYPEFNQLDPRRQRNLIVHHWPEDIRRHRELIEILNGVLKERGNGNQ